MDSADDPLGGRQWWLEADEPWQCLVWLWILLFTLLQLAARDLTAALRHPDGPEHHESRLPVHQDGSCNGLQHYAALGRDTVGASQVDLVPMDMPQDVYSGVMNLVKQQVLEHAAGKYPKHWATMQPEEVERKQKLAKMLAPFIDRKLVKQTVMTSVYGVTLVGARQQIQNRLNEKGFDEMHTYAAAQYLAKLTLDSIGKKFVGADSIKV